MLRLASFCAKLVVATYSSIGTCWNISHHLMLIRNLRWTAKFEALLCLLQMNSHRERAFNTTHGQFPTKRYPAAWASASLVKRTRFCGETFAALEVVLTPTRYQYRMRFIPIAQQPNCIFPSRSCPSRNATPRAHHSTQPYAKGMYHEGTSSRMMSHGLRGRNHGTVVH